MRETPASRQPWLPRWAVITAWLGVGLALILAVFGSRASIDSTPWSVGAVIGPILIAEAVVAGIAMAWFLLKKRQAAFVLGVPALIPFLWVALEVTRP